MSSPGQKSVPARIFDILSGLGLATVLLVILMLETWLATLEQVHFGLFATAEAARTAAETLRAAHPFWWVEPGRILD